MDRYLDVRITDSYEEFIEYSGEKFFMLTIFDIWLANNHDNKTEINWENVFPNYLIQELRIKKHPILVESVSERCTKFSFDALVDFCNYIGSNPNDVYICLANSASVDLNINSYKNLKQYNFLSVERFAFDAVQFRHTVGEIIYKLKFDDRKRFLFLNRRYSSDRAYLYMHFHKLNMLDSMHCTFRLDNIYNDNLVTLDRVIKDIEKTHNTFEKEVIDYIKSNNIQLPHTVKTNNSMYKTDHMQSYLYAFWNLAAHNSTDINIITETFKYHKEDAYYRPLFFITEKTYRTILMKQPFILFSNPYALKYLRNSGYKTFSPFIDESYDDIENLAERQNAIIQEVQRLHNMDEDEFNQILAKCKAISEYNYNHLMQREYNKYHNTIWTNDKFKPYIRDIDRNLKSPKLIKSHNIY